jgi:hypothetical protein
MSSSELFNKAVSKVEQVIDRPSTTESLYKKYEALPLTQQLALSMTPGIGETISAYETPKFAGEAKESFDKGEYLEATGKTAMAGLSALGAIPFLGTGVRAVKGGIKAATKMDEIGEGLSSILKSEKELKKYGDTWKDSNRLPVNQRQAQDPIVKQAAQDLDSGKIKGKQFRDTVKEVLPIKPIDEMVDVPTFDEIAGALKKDQVIKGIVGVNKAIPEGTRLATRLDIPAYNSYNKWIVSIHEGLKGGSVGYSKSARLKDVVFGSSPRTSLDIASEKLKPDMDKIRAAKKAFEKKFNRKPNKEEADQIRKDPKNLRKQPKATIARMEGNWTNTPDKDTISFAERLLKNKKDGKYIDDAGEEWVQVGMNPYRGSYFYDKATGQALQSADELIQVGPLVFAKGSRKPTLSEYKKGFTTTTEAGNKVAFKKGGQVMPMQYGGGLSDAYSTLSDRRRNQNMYGMGDAPMQQMPSQMSSVFQDPMEASAFSPVNMEQGGDIVVPKERMINDQPHQLSYINPQEAGLLKALGGSGRRVDGIPAYFYGSGEDSADDMFGGLDFGDDSGNDTISRGVPPSEEQFIGSQVTSAPQVSQPKEDDRENTLFEQTYQGQRGNALGFKTREGFKQDIKNALENELINAGVKNVDEVVAQMMGKSLGTVAAGSLTGRGGLSTYLDKQNEDIEKALQSRIEELKKEGKVVDEDKGFFGGIKSMLTNDLVGPMSVDPQVLQELKDRGVTDFTPYDKFSPFSLGVGALNAAVQQVPIGLMAAGLSKLTGSEVVGTFTDPLTGQMMALDTLGKTTFISPDALTSGGPDESGFSATDVDAVVPVEEKKIEEKENEKSPMSKLLAQRINNASTIDPNVKIIMDIYGISQEEAQKFLGKKGVGTGGASEFEGI